MVYDIVRDVSGIGLVIGLSTQFAGYVSGDPAIADVGRFTAMVSGLSYLALLEPQWPVLSFDDTVPVLTTSGGTQYVIPEREDSSDSIERRLESMRSTR